jgi:L-aspartate oxidase
MSSQLVEGPTISKVLVVGTGIAGLQFALLAAEKGSVWIVTKKESRESNTNYAQGGIAAAVSPADDFDSHMKDTLEAGDGLCNEELVRRMVEAGPELVERLMSYGVAFSPAHGDSGEKFALGREGGHTRRRVLHCSDLTGREIEQKLLAACLAHPNIQVRENHMGVDLLLGKHVGLEGEHSGRVVGCLVLERETHKVRSFLADAVVLATGGCGKVYSYTSNPDIATGDGLGMAFRVGARLANLEFVQFHPTCLFHPEAKSFLISEAVRGEGAVLINERGEKFMQRYHPLADLAPRDIVARSIDREMKTSGDPCAFLDLRHLPRESVEKRFPNLVRTCAGFGIDMAGQPVPVVPAAHYMCGGVATDGHGRTSLPGLFAIGEVACTGVHGANRLASNSLLEAVYFAQTAREALDQEPEVFASSPRTIFSRPLRFGSGTPKEAEVMVLEHDWDLVRKVMWDYVGIVRENERLQIAMERVRAIRDTVERFYVSTVLTPAIVELRNIALLAELIVLCARSRQESRGLHFTMDYPGRSEEPEDTFVQRGLSLAGEICSEPDGKTE